jgi:hopanoid biosynthesis associated protein HpnK
MEARGLAIPQTAAGWKACRMAQAVTEAPVRAAIERESIQAAPLCNMPDSATAMPRKTLVVNADDFGRSAAVNHAIALAHREGILTSTSLMVSGDAAEQAVALARQMPRLAVGLHLTLADGPAILPVREIPHLADVDGRFRASPARAGLTYFFSRSARRELAKEIRAQFEQFGRTGLELSHVDGHCHLHLHPVVFDLLLPLAEKYGARAVRIVQEDVSLSLAHERKGVLRKVMWAAQFALLRQRARRRLNKKRWPIVERTIGLMQTGNMTEAYVLDALTHLPDGVNEMYFHPSLAGQSDRFGPGPMDLATLLSPTVRSAVEAREIRLSTFPQIALEQRATFFWQPDSVLLGCRE